MEKRTLVDTIKKENERFWILAAHPNINILGAGSDGGSLFFNLNRERIHHVVHNNSVFFIHKNQLKQQNLLTQQVTILKDLNYEKQK